MTDELKKETTAPAPAPVAAVSKPRKGTTVKRQVSRGRAYVQATYNNTVVTLTDMNGDVLAWSSAGHLGFKGPKKATPYAATQIVRDLTQRVQPYGLRELLIFVKGVGSGRESAIRTLNASGFQVLGIKDITPIPHNGPRAPKRRRV